MLVLSRKIGERIRVADNIVITVVQVQGRSVRLGFEAPSRVPILRQELAGTDDPAGADPTARHVLTAD
jgi:carbon storage regulator